MDWSPTGANQKQDFILSLFFLTIIEHPENKNTDKWQATNNRWILPVWFPHQFMVFSAIQSPQNPCWKEPQNKTKNYFYLSDLWLFITTHKSSAAKKRSPQTLLPLFKSNFLPVLGIASLNTPLTIHIKFSLIVIHKNSSLILVFQFICGLSARITFLLAFSPTMNKKEIRFLV